MRRRDFMVGAIAAGAVSRAAAQPAGNGRRLAIVEPVFANLRSNKRLDRFTYRGLA